MVFVSFRYVQIWIFLCSFSPTCLVAKKISIRQKKKKILGHRMGPEVPWPNGARGARGARWGGSGPRKKNPFTNQAGFGSRVQTRGSGPSMKKPDPLPFLASMRAQCFNTVHPVFLYCTHCSCNSTLVS